MSEHHVLYGIVRDAVFAAVRPGNLTPSQDDNEQRKAGKDVADRRHFEGGLRAPCPSPPYIASDAAPLDVVATTSFISIGTYPLDGSASPVTKADNR